jgi:hypothetical protein
MANPRKALLLALAGAAAAQGAVLLGESAPEATIIQTDAELPLPIRWVSDGSPALKRGKCVVLYLLGPDCVHSRIRGDGRRGLAPASIDVVWVLLGSRETAEKFGAELDYRPDELAFLDPQPSRGLNLWGRQRLVLPGTPLRLVLDAELIVRSAVLGAAPLSREEIGEVCP